MHPLQQPIRVADIQNRRGNGSPHRSHEAQPTQENPPITGALAEGDVGPVLKIRRACPWAVRRSVAEVRALFGREASTRTTVMQGAAG
ncbi:hypothetical protein SKAU_G00010790 [Synaphobranchus kaupii]|uniref:Uncharacterized protein n=1 Tax=Synaphobranchus kaupii TaxID=118154 RepID=A0A9Q1GB53_SYNKA|nr:hypothetical protein SKAU_G00010790 [Synaphobranchus kaupii]